MDKQLVRFLDISILVSYLIPNHYDYPGEKKVIILGKHRELEYLLDSTKVEFFARRGERSLPSEGLRKRTGDTRPVALMWIKRLSFSRRQRIRPGGKEERLRCARAGWWANQATPLGGGGCARARARRREKREKEKKTDFLVDYKRFHPSRDEGIYQRRYRPRGKGRSKPLSLVALAGTSEFLTTPWDGHSEDHRSR